jgi:hypothetical protein
MKILMRLLVIMLLGALMAPAAPVVAQEVQTAVVTQEAAPAATCGITGEKLGGGLIDINASSRYQLMEATIVPKGAGGCKTPLYRLSLPKNFLFVVGPPAWTGIDGTRLAECEIEAADEKTEIWRCSSIFITQVASVKIEADIMKVGDGFLLMMRDQNYSMNRQIIVTDKIFHAALPWIELRGAVAASAP